MGQKLIPEGVTVIAQKYFNNNVTIAVFTTIDQASGIFHAVMQFTRTLMH